MRNNIIIILIFLLPFLLIGCKSTQTTLPKVSEAELGNQAFENGEYEKAIEYYDKWLMKYPKDADVLLNRGRAKKQLRKYSEALEDFNNAISANPKDLRPQVYRCGVLLILGQNKVAYASIKEIISHPLFNKLGPYEKFWAYYIDGQLKTMSGEFNLALKSLENAIVLFNLNPYLFQKNGAQYAKRFPIYYKAICYHKLGNYLKAAQNMKIYISLCKKANQKVTSKDYKSLVVALYLADKLKEGRKYLPFLSNEDRQELYKRFDDRFFLLK